MKMVIDKGWCQNGDSLGMVSRDGIRMVIHWGWYQSSEVFFKIKLLFFGYLAPINIFFDVTNKYFSG